MRDAFFEARFALLLGSEQTLGAKRFQDVYGRRGGVIARTAPCALATSA